MIVVFAFLFFLFTKFSFAQVNPPFTGTFVDLVDYDPDLTESQIPQYMDELVSLKMDTIILTPSQSEVKINNSCVNSTFRWNKALLSDSNPDTMKPVKLDIFFDEALKRNIKIYFGILTTGDSCPNYAVDPTSTNRVKTYLENFDLITNPISYVNQKFGIYANFGGWYIPNEPHFVWEDTPSQSEIDYYKVIIGAIRQKSLKTIIITPGLIGTENYSPTVFAAKAKLFYDSIREPEDTNFIFAWQDSVAEVDTNNDLRMPKGDGKDSSNIEYYKKLSQILGGPEHLWSDNELGNCCVAPTYNWWGGMLKPSIMSRLLTQVNQTPAEYVGKRIVWVQKLQMGSISKLRYYGSERLMNSYMAYFGLNSGEYIYPISYSWITPPSIQYPDTVDNKKLIDGKTGEPGLRSVPILDKRWVGIQGRTEVVFDLGQKKNVDYLALHLLSYEAGAVRYPSSFSYYSSLDGLNWINLGTWNFPIVNNFDGEFVFSNPNGYPLNTTCKYLKVKLNSNSWTFISEVEISSIRKLPLYNGEIEVNGDANNDGAVNLLDFGLWKSEYLELVSTKKADFNKDGVTNLLDFGLWKTEYLKNG